MKYFVEPIYQHHTCYKIPDQYTEPVPGGIVAFSFFVSQTPYHGAQDGHKNFCQLQEIVIRGVATAVGKYGDRLFKYVFANQRYQPVPEGLNIGPDGRIPAQDMFAYFVYFPVERDIV